MNADGFLDGINVNGDWVIGRANFESTYCNVRRSSFPRSLSGTQPLTSRTGFPITTSGMTTLLHSLIFEISSFDWVIGWTALDVILDRREESSSCLANRTLITAISWFVRWLFQNKIIS